MIRAVVVVAVLWSIYRKVTQRKKYRLGLLATAGLSVIGACLGGVAGDMAVGGDSVGGDLVAGFGAVAGAVLFVYVGEWRARKKPLPPPRKLPVPKLSVPKRFRR
jgi:uncharacterized membrane protein YeaQ/YmgE (transglycosylase-associated protein family)